MHPVNRLLLGCLAILVMPAGSIAAQQPSASEPMKIEVSSQQRLEILVGSRRQLRFDIDIPRVYIQDPAIINVVPGSPRDLKIIARKQGQTSLYIWESETTVRQLTVIVYSKASKREQLLQHHSPRLTLKVEPAASNAVITGLVPDNMTAGRIDRMAREYFPRVINNLAVAIPPMVVLNTQILEVSRQDAQEAGILWPKLEHHQPISTSTSTQFTSSQPRISESLQIGIIEPQDHFHDVVEALRSKDCAHLMAQPVLVAISGQVATFNSGAQFPILLPQPGGRVSLEYHPIGASVEITPHLNPDGTIRLHVRPRLVEIDHAAPAPYKDLRLPSLKSRHSETTVVLKPGQTLAMIGMPQTRVRYRQVGIPLVEDLPLLGQVFQSRTREPYDVELLIMIRPEIRTTEAADIAGTR